MNPHTQPTETETPDERRERAYQRALYEMSLSCAGKVAAHAAAGEDLSDVDAGLYCGLVHLGACRRDGEDFDAVKFAALTRHPHTDTACTEPDCECGGGEWNIWEV